MNHLDLTGIQLGFVYYNRGIMKLKEIREFEKELFKDLAFDNFIKRMENDKLVKQLITKFYPLFGIEPIDHIRLLIESELK